MGFIFVFLIFPILSIVALVLLFLGKWKLLLKLTAIFFGSILVLGGVLAFVNYLTSPIILSRHDIIGKYEIDTLLYPGKNSLWQFKTYSFEITNKDSLILNIHGANNTNRVVTIKFDQIGVRQDTSKVPADISIYHLFRQEPLLVRGHKKFYYVFGSNYGNMFFTKVRQ